MTTKRISFHKPQTEELNLQFWLRLFAFLIDYLLMVHIVIPIILSGLLFILPLSETNLLPSNTLNNLIGPYGISLLILWMYFAIMESSNIKATLGKWFLRYKVVDKFGNRISFLTALIRFPLKLIAIASLIGVWIIDINKQRKGLHDLICKTLVRRR